MNNFWLRQSLVNFLPGMALNRNPPNLIPRITGVNHQYPAFILLLHLLTKDLAQHEGMLFKSRLECQVLGEQAPISISC
jgi:hypothetical protein